MTTVWDTYEWITHPLALALSDAQQRGVLIDVEARQAMVKEFEEKNRATANKISAIAGREFNPASPTQCQRLLYEDLKLPRQFKRGKLTTDEESLLTLLNQYPDEIILRLILQYRKDTKLVSTFLKVPLDDEGAIHTSFNPSGTKNFRISSSKDIHGSGANLQNIPTGKRPGVTNIRHLFKARPGCLFVKGDLVQAETLVVSRILYRHDDDYLYKRYRDDDSFDIHKWAASTIFNTDEWSVDKHQRDVGKIANHSGNYCSGPRVVMATALKYGVEGINYQVAKKIVASRRGSLPGLARWWDAVQLKLDECRRLTTCLGRHRLFFGRLDDNATLRDAVAFEPQSVVGDVCNLIFAETWAESNNRFWPVLQVHDEVVVEVKEPMVDYVVKLMKDIAGLIMLDLNEHILEPLNIPIEITVGPNWRDCK